MQGLTPSAHLFRNVDACRTSDLRPPTSDVVIGCDLAKHTDHTVLIAMDRKTGHCLEMERFNHLDWPIQKERIVDFTRRYNGPLVMDATGIGDPVYEDLRRACRGSSR